MLLPQVASSFFIFFFILYGQFKGFSKSRARLILLQRPKQIRRANENSNAPNKTIKGPGGVNLLANHLQRVISITKRRGFGTNGFRLGQGLVKRSYYKDTDREQTYASISDASRSLPT